MVGQTDRQVGKQAGWLTWVGSGGKAFHLKMVCIMISDCTPVLGRQKQVDLGDSLASQASLSSEL